MREGIAITAFTETGRKLARRLQEILGADRCTMRAEQTPLREWAKISFARREALLFVGAAGIAVRTIGPLAEGKAEDPAVLVLDETGRHVIPLLSGHLGGANALAIRIAEQIGAEPVITTATDLQGVFAVDLWAKKQGLQVLHPERIRLVSARILRNEEIRIATPWKISGKTPAQVNVICTEAEEAPGSLPDAAVTVRPYPGNVLMLVPHSLTLGIGCRRGTTAETLARCFARFCEERQILSEAIGRVASLDRKADEEGLLTFCRSRRWAPVFYPAEELQKVEGSFSASAFVEQTIGVDNVCERSAVLSSGGSLVESKFAADGVTFAAALSVPQLDWSWT